MGEHLCERTEKGVCTCFLSFLYTTGSVSGPICCLKNDRRIETMMTVSIVSRRQMKKMGTAKTLTMLGNKGFYRYQKVVEVKGIQIEKYGTR